MTAGARRPRSHARRGMRGSYGHESMAAPYLHRLQPRCDPYRADHRGTRPLAPANRDHDQVSQPGGANSGRPILAMAASVRGTSRGLASPAGLGCRVLASPTTHKRPGRRPRPGFLRIAGRLANLGIPQHPNKVGKIRGYWVPDESLSSDRNGQQCTSHVGTSNCRDRAVRVLLDQSRH